MTVNLVYKKLNVKVARTFLFKVQMALAANVLTVSEKLALMELRYVRNALSNTNYANQTIKFVFTIIFQIS